MSIRAFHWTEPARAAFREGAISIGNFDGVHLGHGALVAELRRQAAIVQGPAVVVTFDPHPLQLLRPEQFQPVLTPVADRAELLQKTGADHVLILQTTRELLGLSADDFFTHVIRKALGAQALVEGFNFHFGRNREGDVPKLRSLCEQCGIRFSMVSPFKTPEGVVVSSSVVRSALQRGDVAEAARLLARPYRIRGKVVTGQKRGHQLGFPTANLDEVGMLIPGDGVYAARVFVAGKLWPGAVNIGANPTFAERARKIEVHIIDFAGDLYGTEIGVDFVSRLRDTRAFENVQALLQQLRADVEHVKEMLKGAVNE